MSAGVAGSKYDRSLSTKEVAVRVRAEVKEALRSGKLPAGTKVSVRYDSFAGGSALRIYVMAVPVGFVILNRRRVAWERDRPHDLPPRYELPRFTPEAAALLAAITAMVMAYNRDDSDSMTDHFDVNFYGGDASFDWTIEKADREAAVAEVSGRVLCGCLDGSCSRCGSDGFLPDTAVAS